MGVTWGIQYLILICTKIKPMKSYPPAYQQCIKNCNWLQLPKWVGVEVGAEGIRHQDWVSQLHRPSPHQYDMLPTLPPPRAENETKNLHDQKSRQHKYWRVSKQISASLERQGKLVCSSIALLFLLLPKQIQVDSFSLRVCLSLSFSISLERLIIYISNQDQLGEREVNLFLFLFPLSEPLIPPRLGDSSATIATGYSNSVSLVFENSSATHGTTGTALLCYPPRDLQLGFFGGDIFSPNSCQFIQLESRCGKYKVGKLLHKRDMHFYQKRRRRDT